MSPSCALLAHAVIHLNREKRLAKHAAAAPSAYRLPTGLWDFARTIGASDALQLPAFTGRHRFVVYVPEEADADAFKEHLLDLPDGTRAMVLGAYNRLGKGGERILRAGVNDHSDVKALKEFLDPTDASRIWRPQVSRIALKDGQTPAEAARVMLARLQAYKEKTKKKPIAYPDVLANALGKGKNSNTFVSMLLDQVGAPSLTLPDRMPGADLRLPKELFRV